jgi:hypothetical protein
VVSFLFLFLSLTFLFSPSRARIPGQRAPHPLHLQNPPSATPFAFDGTRLARQGAAAGAEQPAAAPSAIRTTACSALSLPYLAAPEHHLAGHSCACATPEPYPSRQCTSSHAKAPEPSSHHLARRVDPSSKPPGSAAPDRRRRIHG